MAGVLRGFDPFMNLVLDETVEKMKDGVVNTIGMVVCYDVLSYHITLLLNSAIDFTIFFCHCLHFFM